MSCLAIIPARGGSKRIPHKNIKSFCGKPIIAYSIESAIKSQLFEEVMVSTDSTDIKDIAIQFGANIPFLRSAKNADDFATTADVVLEVISAYQKQGKSFNDIAIIYPTAPFISAKKLQEAWQKYNELKGQSLLSMVKYSFPIQRSLSLNKGFIRMNWPENMNTRSQDLEPTFHDAGQFYFIKMDTFIQEKKIFTDKTIGFELKETEVQDIDTLIDWQLAELKFKLLQNEQV